MYLREGKSFIKDHPHFLIVMESKHSGAEESGDI